MNHLKTLWPRCALLSALLVGAASVMAEDKPASPPAAPAEARITIRVPEGAEIFFDGAPTKSKGIERIFVTPPLDVVKTSHYDILVRWKKDGKPFEQTRRVPVQGGAKIVVSFLDDVPPKVDPKIEPEVEREAVARSMSAAGVLLRRQAEDKPWKPVPAKAGLPAGDLILGDDIGAALVSKNGGIRLAFNSDFNKNTPFPVLETAVILHAATDVDLEVTLDRGRIDLVNTKAKGPAHVRLHIQDKSGEITLPEPGDRLAVQIYGRWPRGVPFTKNPKPGAGPALAVVFLAVKGEIEMKGKDKQLTLKAPPGLAMIQAASLHDFDPKAEFVERLPDWAVDGAVDTERALKIKAILAHFRQVVLAKGVGEALDELMKSQDAFERRAAVVLMGALDDLPRLGDELVSSKHPEIWDDAVHALRHWIGRAPGQDQKLYNGLIERRGYKPVEAANLLQMLHSFSDDEAAHPELYELLINYLGNDKLALRGLAHWHLIRLVPAGEKIAFDPHAPKEQRDLAVQEWKKLIPSGKLPPENK